MSRRNHRDILDYDQEAQEVQEQIRQQESPPSSEQQGEDLYQNPEADYRNIEKLDNYQDEGVDDQLIQLNPEARRKAEQSLNKRDRLFKGEAELQELMESQSIELNKDLTFLKMQQEQEFDEEQMQAYIDGSDQKGSAAQWLSLGPVRKYIRHFIIKFLSYFKVGNKAYYFQQVKIMALQNLQSLRVDFQHIQQANPKVAEWIGYHPAIIFPYLNAVLYAYICRSFPAYSQMISQSFLRIKNLPLMDRIPSLKHQEIGSLVRIKGVVTTRSQVYNQLASITMECTHCGTKKGPFYVNNRSKINFGHCFSCQKQGPYRVDSMSSVYRNYQTICVQQSSSEVEPGRIPRSKQAILFGDNVDMAKPGEEVDITGIFSLRYKSAINLQQGFPVFQTCIQVNYLQTFNDIINFSEIDETQFQKLPSTPNFANKMYHSIAPSIYGHYKVKRSLTLAMFGGVINKGVALHHRTRGDINVLIMGDPGLAKSQFLKSVQNVFPKCVYTTGKGASAVGLTACVKMDSQTKQWRLQAGAMVMADRGICLIDEFDKMSQADRTSIHEGMQQQTISISKAGIIATLQARCSIIAAANPEGGVYKSNNSFAQNVQLSEPILSRFDIINVLKDTREEQLDTKISNFVIGQHMNSHPYHNIFSLDQVDFCKEDQHPKLEYSLVFLRQYIKYAREKIHPHLSQASSKVIMSFYQKLREYSLQTGGITITPRHLESLVRLCEAHARMFLRRQTTYQDATVAVSTMLESFLDTQRHSVAERLKKTFATYLIRQ